MITVEFIGLPKSGSIKINLYSHFTCIYGKDSGEGKTFLYTTIEEGLDDGSIEVKVSNGFPFTLATRATLKAILQLKKRHVILIDEATMLSEKLISYVNKSKHIFICIARAMPFKSEYPLKGLYRVVKTKDTLDVVSMDSIPLYDGRTDKDYKIIVEAENGKSESQLLGNYLPNVVSANGRDKIERLLRKTSEDILVFADLGNIGRAYQLLEKRCKDNPNIVFYDYDCFEQLLYNSGFVRSRVKRVKSNVFSHMSIERYYEEVLEASTRGTPIEYEHGKTLPSGYLDKDNFDEVFDSKEASKIKGYIESKK